MRTHSLVFVNQALLDTVDEALPGLMSGNGVSAVLLLERSGTILTHAGEPPLHPDHMAAVASGLFSAMKTLIKATRSEEFLVRIPSNGTVLQFNQVDSSVILLGYYADGPGGEKATTALRGLAERARELLSSDQTQDKRLEAGDFILDKLNEILK
jgi:predicted regulator of Ras-like GTPase activity (Roadblock/LC7/MglB family)